MSYKFTFADNEVYTATDVNNITKRLVTAGVEDSFSDGVAYNVSKFNEATGKLLYTSGTVPESCNSLKVEKSSDSEILINPGYAFFSDGAVIEIDAGGEMLSFVSGSKNYVYLKNDLINTNRCYPVCSVEEPVGDFVLLAEIDENGEITDKRTYAKGKLPGYQSFAGNVLRIQDTIQVTENSNSKTFDIGNNNFEYILVYVERDAQTLPCLGIYDIKNKTYLGFYCTSEELYGGGFYKGGNPSEDSLYTRYYNGNSTQVAFSLDESKLTVTVVVPTEQKGYDVDIILF